MKTEILISTGSVLVDNTNADEFLDDIYLHDGDYYFSSTEKSVAGITLLAKIDTMLTKAGITLNDLDFLACVIGPGSFTGIRIGVSAIRALSYALAKPIIPIIYFDVMAYNSNAPFTTAIDGASGVCYIQSYVKNKTASKTEPQNDGKPTCIKISDIKAHSHKDIVGDSFFSEAISRIVEQGHLPLKNTVEKVAALNNFITYDKLVPLYLRRSQPERESGEL